MFNKPRWQRLIILAAGPFMNVVLAIAVLTGPVHGVRYEKVLNEGGAVVGHVKPDSPAAKAGIQAGDKIVRLERQRQSRLGRDRHQGNRERASGPMTVTIERAGHQFPDYADAGAGREGRRRVGRLGRPERNSGGFASARDIPPTAPV